MNRSKHYILASVSVAVALAAGTAFADGKGTMNFKRSSGAQFRSIQSSGSPSGPSGISSLSKPISKPKKVFSSNSQNIQLYSGNNSLTGTNKKSLTTRPTFVKKNLLPAISATTVTGTTGIPKPPTRTIDPRFPGNLGVFDPGIGGGGIVADPVHPLDPFRPPFVIGPIDPVVTDPVTPNPSPDDPVVQPPVDEPPAGGGGSPPMDPIDPPYCPPNGNGGWNFPIIIPIGGGFGGGGGNTQTVVQPVYTPVAQPVATQVQEDALDLELVEVRQIDRGDLAKNLGPAYRVLIRNKNGAAVVGQFNVALAASIGRQATPESALATVRVNGLEAGKTLAVDVRLPAKAYKLGVNADGQNVPFSYLTAVADVQQEVTQADHENDYMVLSRAEIVMVAQN